MRFTWRKRRNPSSPFLGTNMRRNIDKNPFVFKSLDASTAHISKSDNELLRLNSLEKPVKGDFQCVHGHLFGYFVYATNLTLEEKRVLYVAGYSKEYIELLGKATKLDCKFLALDGDGITYDDLPAFDWEKPDDGPSNPKKSK